MSSIQSTLRGLGMNSLAPLRSARVGVRGDDDGDDDEDEDYQ